MAGKKKSYRARKKRSYKKRKSYKKSGLAPKWQKVAKVESKYLDGNLGDSIPISNTGGILLASLNAISQGPGTNQRIGRQVLVKSLTLHMDFTMPAYINTDVSNTAVPAVDDDLRIYLILDTKKNGLTPVWTDIFSGTNFSDFVNIGTSKRFRIMKMWNISMRPDSTVFFNVATGKRELYRASLSVIKKKTIKMKIPINWSPTNTNGDPAAMNDNNLLLCGISTNALTYLSGGTGGSAPFFTSARVRFTDA